MCCCNALARGPTRDCADQVRDKGPGGPVSYRTLDMSWPSRDVALVTLDRPDRHNAISLRMLEEFAQLQTDLAEADVRALVLTGAGHVFCCGLDSDELARLPSIPAAEMLREQARCARAIAGFAHLPLPVIAAINGPAVGAGVSLALMADIRVAATTTRFSAASMRAGLEDGDCVPSWCLPRLVGLSRATEITLTSKVIVAEQARDIGLVDGVSKPEAVLERALAVAAAIADTSTVDLAKGMSVNVEAPSFQVALNMENRNQMPAAWTDDISDSPTGCHETLCPTFVGC